MGLSTVAREERISRGTWMALAAMGLAVFVIANDFTAMAVALADIEHDFNADVATVQWVINAYALVFGVLIITGGKLADLYGRRRIFFVGAAIFALFSLLGGLATNAVWLIVARAIMGVGGALMWPAVLGMTFVALPPRKAGLAGGLILGLCGIGNAAGPLIGGVLIAAFNWRWILFLNVPIAMVACVVTWLKVHQPTGKTADARLDYTGVSVLSIGLVSLLFALDEASAWGFSNPFVLGLFVLFVVLIAVFPFVEKRAGEQALLPGSLLRSREFASSCVAVLLLSSIFFAAIVYLPEFMQKILGYSALEAGLGLLPMMLTFTFTSFAAGTLYERLGAKLIIALGAALMTIGALLLSFLQPQAGFGSIVAAMILLGIGLGLFISSVTTAGVTALDPSQASLAGGVIYLFQIAGGSIGLGLVTAVFISTANASIHAADVANQLTNVQEQALLGVLAGTSSAQTVVNQFPAHAGEFDLIVRGAFAAGMHVSFRLVAAFGALGFLVAFFFVGGRLHLWRRGAAETMPIPLPLARFHHRAYHWGKTPATLKPSGVPKA
ncbi:MAG: DHA2 family efflux MFS transporter permease subunit [Gammaproteobacteria bacterium]